MLFKISPNYTETKLANPSFDDLVDVYEDRVRGWLIDSARILNTHEHAGFGVLQVVLAYFEGHSIFYRGENSRHHSLEFFRDGFLSAFPDIRNFPQDIIDEIVEVLYFDGRCGLYHTGMARRRIALVDGESVFRVWIDPLTNSVSRIDVDRHRLVQEIDEHLATYIAQLRDPAKNTLRSKFVAAWNLVNSI